MTINPLTSPTDRVASLEMDSEPELQEGHDMVLTQKARPPALRGLYAQYFVVGLVCGVLPGTLYGFFMGYLHVDAHVYVTAMQVIALPWSFKFAYGILNDCVPLKGYRRKPYMVIGWTICAAALAALANVQMPPRDDKGAAGAFAARMTMAAVGYVMADVAADSLVVQYAKDEPLQIRGTLQANMYLVRTIGSIAAALFVGIGMNGTAYNGSFSFTLSFSQVCGCLAVPAVVMAPVSWLYIDEPVDDEPVSSVRVYLSECWDIIESKAMFYIIVYNFGHAVIGDIYTTAGANVSLVWAGVENLQAKLFSVVAMAIFASGIAVVKKYFLNTSWRKILCVTTLLLGTVDAIFAYCTIFDVVRNQYFFLGEEIIVMVPAAARFLVTTFVVVEVSPSGKEGITYGMLTTIHNLGGPIARAISNQIFGLGFTGLSTAQNYVEDSPAFRREVAWSYAVGYAAGLLALAFLFFLPDQKVDAQHRVKHWPSSKRYAQVTLTVVSVCWVYAVTVNLLAMFPSTSCSQWVGGDGC